MLDLCKCDVMEELDKELAGDVSLVTRSPSTAMRMAGVAMMRV